MQTLKKSLLLGLLLFSSPFLATDSEEKEFSSTESEKTTTALQRTSLLTPKQLGAQFTGVLVATIVGSLLARSFIFTDEEAKLFKIGSFEGLSSLVKDDYKYLALIGGALVAALLSFYSYLLIEQQLASTITADTSGMGWFLKKSGAFLGAFIPSTAILMAVIDALKEEKTAFKIKGIYFLVGGLTQPFLAWLTYKGMEYLLCAC